MPYQQYLGVNRPTNVHAKIWRYMDLAKFISLLDSGGLYFTRLDRFEDRFEGAVTRPMLGQFQGTVTNLPPGRVGGGLPPEEEQKRQMQRIALMRKTSYASCWNQNDYESEALWSLYASRNAGIAIQSSFARLSRCFKAIEEHVIIGTVAYVDYDMGSFDDSLPFVPLFHKRMSFDHEREVRAIIWRGLAIHQKLHPGSNMTNEHEQAIMNAVVDVGITIACDLEILIENIYVSPLAKDWFAGTVQSVLNRYGFSRTVVHSDLSADPPGTATL